MHQTELLSRIWTDSARCGGEPCIRGRRIAVSLVLDRLAAGESAESIATDYDRQLEDVRTCLAYASQATTQKEVGDSVIKRYSTTLERLASD